MLKLKNVLGNVLSYEKLAPGVYYISVDAINVNGISASVEYYAIDAQMPVFSKSAKSYGAKVDGIPGLLLYSLEDYGSGQWIIKYELAVYNFQWNRSEDIIAEMHEAAAFGREFHPEYFGQPPVPYHTPLGCVLRCVSLDFGIYWIETDQPAQALCVCLPVWDDLSDYAKGISIEASEAASGKPDSRLHCLFFSWNNVCVPLFELMRTRPQWQTSGVIDGAALMNAVAEYHPDYMLWYNLSVQSGLGDTSGLLIWAFGGDADLKSDPALMITVSPEKGTDYLHLESLCGVARR